MKRQVVRMSDGKVFESIASAERELNVYNITYNCQNKINYVYARGGKGRKIYEQWMYKEDFDKLNSDEY